MKKLKQAANIMRSNWENTYNAAYNKVSTITIGLAVVMMSSNAAAAAKKIDPNNFFQKVIDLLTGTMATSLAIIAVILLGLSAMFGMFDMRKAGMIILGIVLVFGAAWIVEQITS